MKLYDKVKYTLKGLNGDKIVSVELPYGNIKSLAPVHGWTVVVNYENNGRKTVYFPEDDERNVIAYGSARQAAYDRYELYRGLMRKQQKLAEFKQNKFVQMFIRQK